MTERRYKRIAYRIARRLGWHLRHDEGIRHRFYHLILCRDPWWQWGHRVMILTGTDFSGSFAEPKPPTWFYKRGRTGRMWRTGYPRLRGFDIVTAYAEFQRRTEGLNEDGRYEWQAICVDSDHELILGHRFWGGSFYGMRKDEVRLLRRYLRMWRRHDWYGLRSWLYSQGLHQAVNGHRPWSCAVVPPERSGGYRHWHCELDRRHAGPHKYRNYEWDESVAEVVYAPERTR